MNAMTTDNLVKKLLPQFAMSAFAMTLLTMAGSAQATSFTMTSPASGVLPNTVSEVGGVVLDLVGTNNAEVTSQLSASSLFEGYYRSGYPTAFRGNPGTIGIQSGFTPSITGALGGGLQKAAIRVTLFDGDTAEYDFDFNYNTLLVNGLNFGNFSTVNTQETSSTGNAGPAGFSGGGFRDEALDTGFFSTTDPTLLTSFYNSLVSSQQVRYQVNDVDPYDNYFDFTQGIAQDLINVGQPPVITLPPPVITLPPPIITLPPPVITPPAAVPEPEFSSLLLVLGAWGAMVQIKRRQKRKFSETAFSKQ